MSEPREWVVDAVPVRRPSKVSQGFHRLGLVLALPFVPVAIFVFFWGAFSGEAKIAIAGSGFLLALAWGLYSICRLLAWILEGFTGRA